MIATQTAAINMLKMDPRTIRKGDPARSRTCTGITETRVDPVTAFDVLLAGIELVKTDTVPRIEDIIHFRMHTLPDKRSRIVITVKIRQSRCIIQTGLI